MSIDSAATDAAPATMPPLSMLLGLETHTLMGVVDAMLAGATWSRLSAPGVETWRLDIDDVRCCLFPFHGKPVSRDLPDPLREDAAAYRMETRERVSVTPFGSRFWSARHHWRADPVIHEDRQTAACLAVCHRYADHPYLWPLCRELITRLTSKENTR